LETFPEGVESYKTVC